MIIVCKVIFLLMFFITTPAMFFGGLRGAGWDAGQASVWTIGAVGFITLQWLV